MNEDDINNSMAMAQQNGHGVIKPQPIGQWDSTKRLHNNLKGQNPKIVTGDANALRQRMLANPGRGYGQQALDAAESAGRGIGSGIDSVRNLLSGQQSNGMRFNQQKGADTINDLSRFMESVTSGQRMTPEAYTGAPVQERRIGAKPPANIQAQGVMPQQNIKQDMANNASDLQIQALGAGKTAKLPNDFSPNIDASQAVSSEALLNNAPKQAQFAPSMLNNNPGALPITRTETGGIRFMNADGTGQGEMQFNDPLDNARMAEKMKVHRGTVSVLNPAENGASLGANWADGIRADTLQKINAAVDRGDINAGEAVSRFGGYINQPSNQAVEASAQRKANQQNIDTQKQQAEIEVERSVANKNNAESLKKKPIKQAFNDKYLDTYLSKNATPEQRQRIKSLTSKDFWTTFQSDIGKANEKEKSALLNELSGDSGLPADLWLSLLYPQEQF